jgi:NAD(P)H-dependent flavin oxidoreductase YrpB (nitropropane dioxygenase family)
MAEKTLHTKICDLLGIKYPVFLAGMGAIPGMPRTGKYYTGTSPELVAAVSNAGGFGVFGAAVVPPEGIEEEVAKIRSLTSKPFGVDLMFPAVVDQKTQDEISKTKESLPTTQKEFYIFANRMREKYGLPKVKAPDYFYNTWDPAYVRKQFDAALEAKAPVAICSGVGTSKWAVDRIHEAGKLSVSLIGNTRQAKRVAEMGTDIVVAQGTEAGGHTGRIGTLTLVPQVVDCVSPIPVVAAGGIGDGRTLAAVLALGAVGAWVGTAFLISSESSFTDAQKERLLRANEEGARITTMFTGKTCRAQRNPIAEEWERMGFKSLGMPLQSFLVADMIASIEKAGKPELCFLPSGQVVGMLKGVRPAREILEDMVQGAVNILKQDALNIPAGVV